MDKEPDFENIPLLDNLRICISKGQITEATLLVCGALGGKSSEDCEPDEQESLSLFCTEILPKLLNHHITWLVSNPHLLPLILDLVNCTRVAGFDQAKCEHFILRIHCIQAFYYANQSNWDQAKVELMLAINAKDPKQLMSGSDYSSQKSIIGEILLENVLNASRQDVDDPKIRESMLLLYDEIKDILSCVTREETRSGVVRAIVVDHTHKRAVIRLLLVRIADKSDENPTISYLPAANEKIEEQPTSAQRIALDVADLYLRKHDYPDGLHGKEIRWQLLSDQDMPPQDTKAYEGDSLSVALCTAIISEYLNQPVPSDIAMTGAFHVDSLHEGRIAPVNFIQTKVMDSIKSGIRILYLPDQNKPQLDVAALKTAEEHRCNLRFVRNIGEVHYELFVKEVPPGAGQFIRDMKSTLYSFFPRKTPVEKHPTEVVPSYKKHIWLSTFLTTMLFVLDWFMLIDSITLPSFLRMALGSSLIACSLLISYALPFQLIRRKITSSWYIGSFITFVAVAMCCLLISIDVPWKSGDITYVFDWPPILAVAKDYFIYWIFIWSLVTNAFNVHVAYQSLLLKRQFRTLQQCLKWESRKEGNMPISCFPFPIAWAALGISGVLIFLLVLEYNYYTSFREGIENTAYIISFAVSRDLLFIVTVAEVMMFYKNAVANVKKELFA